jgi:hypothetical protein
MTKRIYFISLILILAACQPQLSSTPFYEGQEVTLTASVPSSSLGGKSKQLPPIQRITGIDSHPQSTTDGAINLSWSAGDQILVTVNGQQSIFYLTSGEGTDQATFRGTMPADGTEYHVSYPVAYHDSLLRHQNYVKNGFGNGLMKMSTRQAGTLDKGFELHADNALLGLQLKGEHILGKICVTNLSNDSTYTLHCDGVSLQTDAAMLFYLVVPVAGWSDGMRVEVYNEDGRIILRKEKADAMAFAAAEAIVMPTLETRDPSKAIGIFSVSNTKKVSFAPGNLQYIPSTKTWQFAQNQWDYLGEQNRQGEIIDLLAWSEDANKQFVDWGTHIIHNDAPNTWRTLSIDEWGYLLHDRTDATKLMGAAHVEGVSGLVVLPDDWVCPEGLTFISLNEVKYTWDRSDPAYKLDKNQKDIDLLNIYNASEWQQMEQRGAVFMPSAGFLTLAGELGYLGKVGRYWSSTPQKDTKGYYISWAFFTGTNQTIRLRSHVNLDQGHTVRLVHDMPSPL